MAANKQGKMVSLPTAVLYALQSFCDTKLIMSIAKSRESSSCPRWTIRPGCERDLLTKSQINYRMRITLNDGRQMTGQMLAFDKAWHIIGWLRGHTDNCGGSI